MVWFKNTLDHNEGRTKKYDTNAPQIPFFISDSARYPVEYPNQKPHFVFTFNPSEIYAAFPAAVTVCTMGGSSCSDGLLVLAAKHWGEGTRWGN